MDWTPDAYDYILQHYESPYHKGRLCCATCTHEEANSTCGDYIRLELLVQRGCTITKAYFDGRGCVISQAAASILCEFAEGRTLTSMQNFTAKDMLNLLSIPLTPKRMQCGLLAFKALKTLLYSTDFEHDMADKAPRLRSECNER